MFSRLETQTKGANGTIMAYKLIMFYDYLLWPFFMYTFELHKHVSHWLYLGVESIVTLTDCSLMSGFLISD